MHLRSLDSQDTKDTVGFWNYPHLDHENLITETIPDIPLCLSWYRIFFTYRSSHNKCVNQRRAFSTMWPCRRYAVPSAFVYRCDKSYSVLAISHY